MLTGPVFGAQARCTSAADEAAFGVGALKSELSVLAIQCDEDQSYNRFVERTRSELIREDGVVNAWFKRSYGKAAQPRYDSYITTLANEQSISGQHEGSDLCPRMHPVFAEAMAVPVASLPEYAAAKNMLPNDMACTSETASASTAHGGRTTTTTRKTTSKK